MLNYITKETAIKSAWMILEGLGYREDVNPQLADTVVKVFQSAPSEEVRKVERGFWHDTYLTSTGRVATCSICGQRSDIQNEFPKYCPSCGAYLGVRNCYNCIHGKRRPETKWLVRCDKLDGDKEFYHPPLGTGCSDWEEAE